MRSYGNLACHYRVGKIKRNKMSVITKLLAQSENEEQEALLRQKAMLIIMEKPTPYVWKRVTTRLIKCINNMRYKDEKQQRT